MLEEKILKSFINYMDKEVQGLDLMVSMPDPEDWDEEHICEVMEKQDNGKVWTIKCTKTGNVKNVWKL